MKTSTVTINSLDIFYRQIGETDPPVVFVHGLSMSSEVYVKQLESSLADSYRLIAMDLPGHGNSSRSDNPRADYSLRGYAETVAAFARKVNAEEALFVGLSLGGHILLEATDLLNRAKGFLIFAHPL